LLLVEVLADQHVVMKQVAEVVLVVLFTVHLHQ
jgi:hypothetical protein